MGVIGEAVFQEYIDDKLVFTGGRGFNVSVFNPSDLTLESSRTFDTWGNAWAQGDLVKYLGSIPPKKVIMVLVGDEAGFVGPMSVQPVVDMLEFHGAVQARSIGFRSSYGLISTVGGVHALNEAVAASGDVTVTYSPPSVPDKTQQPHLSVTVTTNLNRPIISASVPRHSRSTLQYSTNLNNWTSVTNSAANGTDLSFYPDLSGVNFQSGISFRTYSEYPTNNFRAVSRGARVGSRAEIWRGLDLLFTGSGGAGGGRGCNIVICDPKTGAVLGGPVNFDTYSDWNQSTYAVNFMKTAPKGSLIMIAPCDAIGGVGAGTPSIVSYLRDNYGATLIGNVPYQGSYVFAGIDGLAPFFEQIGPNYPVEAVVEFPQGQK